MELQELQEKSTIFIIFEDTLPFVIFAKSLKPKKVILSHSYSDQGRVVKMYSTVFDVVFMIQFHNIAVSVNSCLCYT